MSQSPVGGRGGRIGLELHVRLGVQRQVLGNQRKKNLISTLGVPHSFECVSFLLKS